MNYYELLEVSETASVEVIKNAYKTLAKKYHPDAYRGDPVFAEDKMKLLNEAVDILTDPAKRDEYDRENNIKRDYDLFGKPKDYIKEIDEFIGKKTSARNRGSGESGKKKEPFEVRLHDIEEISGIDDESEYEEYLESLESSGEIPRASDRKPLGKWYYYLIAGLVLANIVMIILLYTSFDFTLLKELTGG